MCAGVEKEQKDEFSLNLEIKMSEDTLLDMGKRDKDKRKKRKPEW